MGHGTLGQHASEKKYYGVRTLNGYVGIIMQDGPGTWKARSLYGITRGAFFGNSLSGSLKECIENMLESGGRVYEFHTWSELALWIADR